jgi:hypothetical protein
LPHGCGDNNDKNKGNASCLLFVYIDLELDVLWTKVLVLNFLIFRVYYFDKIVANIFSVGIVMGLSVVFAH